MADAKGIVRRAAELIEPGIFDVWYDGTGPDAKPHPDSRERLLRRSSAVLAAVRVLELAAKVSRVELRRELADEELRGWAGLGLRHRGLKRFVYDKHGVAR